MYWKGVCKRIILLLLSCLLLLPASCGGPVQISESDIAESSGETSKPETESLPVDKPDKEAMDTEEEDSSREISAPVTEDWAYLAECYEMEETAHLALIFSSGDRDLDLEGQFLYREEWDSLPDEEGLDTEFFGFVPRYGDCTLTVEPVTLPGGGTPVPDGTKLNMVAGDPVFVQEGISGAYGLSIPCLYVEDEAHPGEKLPAYRYKVTLSWVLDGKLEKAVYYPVPYGYYATDANTKVGSFFQYTEKEEEEMALKEAEEDEDLPEEETEVDYAYEEDELEIIDTLRAFPSPDIALIALSTGNLSKLEDIADVEAFLAEAYAASTTDKDYEGFKKNSEIGALVEIPGVGYLCRISAGGQKTALFDSTGSYIGYESGESYYHNYDQEIVDGCWKLPGSGYLVVWKSAYFLIMGTQTQPTGIQRIHWLVDETYNPSNEDQSLLFGATSYSYRDAGQQGYYIVLVRNSNGFTHYYYTRTIQSQKDYNFASLLLDVFANPDFGEYDFSPARERAVEFSLKENKIHLWFPESFAHFYFDFENFTIAYEALYDRSIMDLETTSVVDTTVDGRFYILKINQRYGHESTWSCYALYDSLTGEVEDFGALDLMGNFRLSFMDEGTAALYFYSYSGTYYNSDSETYSEYLQRTTAQRVDLYNLYTKEQHTVNLDLSEYGWSHLIWGYAWDATTNRHILLSHQMTQTDEDSPLTKVNESDIETYRQFIVSYFSADGKHLESYWTGQRVFDGKFIVYVPLFKALGNNRAFFYHPHDKERSFCFDPATGECERYYDEAVEYKYIQTTLNAAENPEDEYSDTRIQLHTLLYTWDQEEIPPQYFSYILDYVKSSAGDLREFYIPELDVLVDSYGSNNNSTFLWLGKEEGETVVKSASVPMNTGKHYIYPQEDGTFLMVDIGSGSVHGWIWDPEEQSGTSLKAQTGMILPNRIWAGNSGKSLFTYPKDDYLDMDCTERDRMLYFTYEDPYTSGRKALMHISLDDDYYRFYSDFRTLLEE